VTTGAQPGHFYAVGVGPGAPELLTVQATEVIRTADLLFAPRAETAPRSLALEAARPWVDGKEVIEHVYPMSRDLDRTLRCWSEVADRVVEVCNAGRSVAQITLGDPLIYSTSAYLLGLLEGRLPRERTHVIPGISAFQAAASRFGEPLLLQEDRLLLMPATDLRAVEEALDSCETLALYKAGPNFPALKELLTRRGLATESRAVFYVDQGDRETVVRDLSAVDPSFAQSAGYMATVIVHVGRRKWTR
jgi:precorrin-2/cobalt-factor-2 C20-methyltransferase